MRPIPRQIWAEKPAQSALQISQSKASSQRNVLRRPLKDCNSSQDLSTDGRCFHSDGAAYDGTLTHGTWSVVTLDDLSDLSWGLAVTSSLMYEGAMTKEVLVLMHLPTFWPVICQAWVSTISTRYWFIGPTQSSDCEYTEQFASNGKFSLTVAVSKKSSAFSLGLKNILLDVVSWVEHTQNHTAFLKKK